ncbi:hypothetical protein [Nocardioides sp. URHA0020]|uniref:hypothetical protein n=1 Tax=Nocardioides sp. URHA0020 TaxID=1380392 RepID=UPI0004906BCE|nr:hypothetical protein [Nocardioides sp. URHA0020]
MLLTSIIRLSRAPKDAGIFLTFFNPAAFFVLFATLFFILPEIYGIAHDFYLDDFPALGSTKSMEEMFVSGAWGFAIFLFFVALGIMLARPTTRRGAIPNASSILLKPLTRRQLTVLIIFLLAGVLANIYLSVQYSNATGFRSQLVKSWQGRLVTTVVYFGEFAVAIILAQAIAARRYALGFLAFGIFAASVTLTESRGRILWPAAIAVILLIASGRRMRYGRLIIAALVAVGALLLLDPLTKYLTTGEPISLSAVLNVDSLFQHRNFDGMSNFVLISQSGYIDPDPSRWLTGANDDFMNTFFPLVLAQGVAFGVSVPGWFYMAGGLVGVCIGATFYGVGLEYLNHKIRTIRSPELLVGYLFAITWLAAVGGNFVGSLDKAFANFVPAVVYLMLSRPSPRPRPSADATRVPRHSGPSPSLKGDLPHRGDVGT